jgi:hypothetical protein
VILPFIIWKSKKEVGSESTSSNMNLDEL